ncbi:MAG TPA: MerR family transcriptional regulator [Pyrinomonadaceae bacterium]|nr:MerR family transcriptional regulator [Pyrinomonadaceae bacterium]
MSENSYSLIDLADAAGIEARTIRSYIERGLLPGAVTKGRAASYSEEHLSRLEVIKSLRRARPNIPLSELRIFLEGLNPERLHALAGGSITASARAIDESMQPDEADPVAEDDDEIPRMIDSDRSAAKLTGAERLVRLLREVSGVRSPAPAAKVEGWQRIAVTPDIEFSVRAEFDANQLMAFRELADQLRQLLQHSNALSSKGDE